MTNDGDDDDNKVNDNNNDDDDDRNNNNTVKPTVTSDPEKWLEAESEKADLLCLVFFRGSWCKYDKYYLRRLGHFIQSKVKEEKVGNVTLIAWTSEGEEGARKADREWALTKECGYHAVCGDSTNALANYLVEDEILPDLVIKTPAEAKVTDLLPNQHGSTAAYPNGIVMPALVWYAHHGSAPVFEWVHPCDDAGCGGPGRPKPIDMWTQVIKRKQALDHGNAVMPSHGSNVRMCTNDFDVFISSCSIL